MNWIKCSDRLPRGEHSVIVCYKWKGFKGKLEKSISMNFFCGYNGWRKHDDHFGDVEAKEEITHWMPFPKEPVE